MRSTTHSPLSANPGSLKLFLSSTSCCCFFLAFSPNAADGSELESVAPKGMTNVVARLEAFAGMSRMKRLALVVLCHTVTDKHLLRLKVGCEYFTSLTRPGKTERPRKEPTGSWGKIILNVKKI
jgi:hypothetical protein